MIAPLDRFRLDGRVAMVTGASSGLGYHFAQLLAGVGATVIAGARRKDKLLGLVEEIANAGGRAIAVELDVTNQPSIIAALDEAEARFGVPDVLVNNAGVTITKSLLEQSEADWDEVVDTNLKGAWMMAAETARRMVAKARSGSIVNVSSILGERVAAGVGPYAVSKAGLLQATRVMALELARHRIRVNALLPGYVVTELNDAFLASDAGQKLKSRIPTREFGTLDGLDGPLLLLASEAGAMMTGACVTVDGGHLVSSL